MRTLSWEVAGSPAPVFTPALRRTRTRPLGAPLGPNRCTAGSEQENPWLVFTAGPMGAGKSFVIKWMSKAGHFQLPSIVQIDPGAPPREPPTGAPRFHGTAAASPIPAPRVMLLLRLTSGRHPSRCLSPSPSPPDCFRSRLPEWKEYLRVRARF